MALEADVERLRGQLDEASDRVQQMGASAGAGGSVCRSSVKQLQTEKAEAEAEYQV